jgi:predicted membrane protein
MIQHKYVKKLFAAMIIIAVIAFIGCEKKTEQQQTEVKSESISPDTISSVSESMDSEPFVEEKITIPDIKGTWTGTFDKRATTLKITEQTDSSFSGKITINYREVINQEVKGTISPSTGKISMKDQLHSRYQGKYNGKLSEEGNNFSGTFTMDLDGKKFTFNLNKK